MITRHCGLHTETHENGVITYDFYPRVISLWDKSYHWIMLKSTLKVIHYKSNVKWYIEMTLETCNSARDYKRNNIIIHTLKGSGSTRRKAFSEIRKHVDSLRIVTTIINPTRKVFTKDELAELERNKEIINTKKPSKK